MLKNRFFRTLLLVVLGSLYSSSFYSQFIKNDSLNVLFIGNSYTHMNNMPGIFDKIAKAKGKLVHVEKNTQSGASFQVHSTRLDLFRTINSKHWDFIVLQGYSRELTYSPSHIDSASVPFINQIIDSIKLNNSCTNLLLYNTWGYKFGFIEREEVNTYEKMQDSINARYLYLSKKYNIPIVPVGMVWKNVLKLNPQLNLYNEDKEHPNKIGSYLVACTFYAAIFKDSPEGVITSTISSKHAKLVQKEAYKYVSAHYERLNLSLNTSTINAFRTSDVKYVLECRSNYPTANCIMWEFDDGSYSNAANPIHLYKKPGRYKVRLYIDDECGERIFDKKVFYSKPKKPKKPVNSAPVVSPTTKKKI